MCDPTSVLAIFKFSILYFKVKQVFSDMDFLGWYTTGEQPTTSDINVHKQVSWIYISLLTITFIVYKHVYIAKEVEYKGFDSQVIFHERLWRRETFLFTSLLFPRSDKAGIKICSHPVVHGY